MNNPIAVARDSTTTMKDESGEDVVAEYCLEILNLGRFIVCPGGRLIRAQSDHIASSVAVRTAVLDIRRLPIRFNEDGEKAFIDTSSEHWHLT